MSRIVIVGAGKTGRGFLARLLRDQQLVLIDRDAELIGAINQERQLEITFFGDKKAPITVPVAEAHTWQTVTPQTFAGVELILISVGGTNLADVGVSLRPYVNASMRLIVCENTSSPAKKLGAALAIPGIRIAESTVFCTTIEREPGSLAIRSEWYPYLQFDGDALGADFSAPEGLRAIPGFSGFLDRKLYTYNSASCIIAYLGALKGYTVYGDAANDPQILSLLDENYAIINRCICQEYGYEEQDQQEFAQLSRDKFTDRTLVDTVARNAREPQRKLTRTERIVAPMLLEQKYGMDSSILEKTLAAALRYTPEQEQEWRALLTDKGYEGILRDVCQLDPDSAIYARILNMAKTGRIL